VKKDNQPAAPAPKQSFYLPEFGVSVEAGSFEEAIKKAKAENKEGEE
jgi:hypothetical protein